MLRDISLHIHDLAENSVTAGAGLIGVTIAVDGGLLRVEIRDDGCGMSEELLARVTDPFTTGRKERNVGMGIPFFKLACEQTGGSFRIESELGRGTVTTGEFVIDSIDRLPLGDIGETVTMLILEKPSIRYVLDARTENDAFEFDTDAIRRELDGAPIESYEILQWIKEYVNEGVNNIFGGVLYEIIGGA